MSADNVIVIHKVSDDRYRVFETGYSCLLDDQGRTDNREVLLYLGEGAKEFRFLRDAILYSYDLEDSLQIVEYGILTLIGDEEEPHTRSWNLWLDDVRSPVDFDPYWERKEYVWATTPQQAKYYVQLWGSPSLMALDHDLGVSVSGETLTTMEFLRWLSEQTDIVPSYTIHTSNPVGREQISSFLKSWEKTTGPS